MIIIEAALTERCKCHFSLDIMSRRFINTNDFAGLLSVAHMRATMRTGGGKKISPRAIRTTAEERRPTRARKSPRPQVARIPRFIILYRRDGVYAGA